MKKRKWTLWLLSGVILSFVAEATACASVGRDVDGTERPQDLLLYPLSSTLVWTCISVALYEMDQPVWYACLGSWTIGVLVDAALLALARSHGYTSEGLNSSSLAIRITRIILQFALIIVALIAMVASGRNDGIGEETEPLLGNTEEGSTSASDLESQYGSLHSPAKDDSDSEYDSEDEDRGIKELQKTRMEQGGMWNYVKGFLIFLPYIWPSNDRRMQLWLLVMFCSIGVERVLTLLVPRQLGIVTDALVGSQGRGYFPWKELLIWGILHMLSVSAGTELLKSMASNRINAYTRKQLTAAAFDHVMGLSMDYHTSKSSGELLKAIEQGTDLGTLLDTVIFGAGPMIIDLVIAAIYLSSVFDGYMALIIITTSLAYVYSGLRGNKFAVSQKREYNEASRKENEVLYDAVSNWQTVAYNNRRDYEYANYVKAVERNIRAEIAFWDISQYIDTTESFVMALGLLCACALAAHRIADGKAPVGHFVMLLTYWNLIESPLSHLAWTYRHTSSVLISAERLLQLLQTRSSVQDAADAEPLCAPAGRVDFTSVTFAYDPRKPALRDVTLTAYPGQTIALVGQTGGGKSTLLKLLFRFYDPSAGRICIDGQDIRHVTLSSLRAAFGVVPQDPSLFNRSIMENLRYARPSASDADVYAACRAAAIHDRVVSFPDGYASRVGERGVRLSGGELQRLAIARVFLQNPRIVLLDEATSAVDSETEARIQEAFARLSAGRTTFVIAHRLSTVVSADLIVVVEDGEVVERGTHVELLRRKSKYAQLWAKQISEKVEEEEEKLIDCENEGM
ncbi:Putative ABC transporter protein [Macrophomina phaseolina MS6]|uniref:Putative ABC transporter protein n=1 Tax=Macrophomina phaseolina (strain MS6) TaxID=1126212 RepID=K2RE27_MACPH|nr:Putative ABC transporter protein [Macrophomina phaseolina MS6]